MGRYTCFVYRDGRAEWRWQLRALNGNILADSGEGYVSRTHATKMAQTMYDKFRVAKFVLVEAGTVMPAAAKRK